MDTSMSASRGHPAVPRHGLPDVVPLSAVMGAEIRNVDLAQPLSEATLAIVDRAFVEHHVIAFPGQSLTPAAIERFAGHFGAIEAHTIRKPDGNVLEGVHEVSNLDASGTPAEKPHINANYYWHSDKAHYPVPSLLSMLYAVELPPSGGETEFANMAMAYDDLPEQTKERIAGLRVVNDFCYTMDKIGKALSDQERRAVPPVVHPMVRTHPATGRKSLFLGMYSESVVGIPQAEGRALIAELIAFATQPKYTFRYQWRLGDLIAWDNRCLDHRAIMNYAATQYRRVLWRCVVRGTVPV